MLQRTSTPADRLARRLADTTPAHVVLLQDRRVPGGREPLDLVAVTPNGVWALTAHGGGTQAVVRHARLVVDGRDRTRLVHRATVQAAVLAEHVPHGVPVRAAVCLLDAALPLVGTLHLGGTDLLRPRRLARHLATPGALGTGDVLTVARELAARL